MEGKVLAIFEESAELKRRFAEKNVDTIVDLAVTIAEAFKKGNGFLRCFRARCQKEEGGNDGR